MAATPKPVRKTIKKDLLKVRKLVKDPKNKSKLFTGESHPKVMKEAAAVYSKAIKKKMTDK